MPRIPLSGATLCADLVPFCDRVTSSVVRSAVEEVCVMRVLVLGAGGVGSAAARIAARRDFFEALTIADYDPVRAQAVVDELGDSRFSAAKVDASDPKAVEALVRSSGATH